MASLVAAILAAPGVSAARAGQSLGLSTGTENICGGPEIWRLLTADKSVEGVQNIKWSAITAKAEDHIKSQWATIQTIKAEIEGLDASIAAAMGKEKASPTTEQQLTDLVHAGAVVFKGVETAQQCMCGKPGLRPRFRRDATQKSTEAFKAAAAALFNGEVRLAGDFLKVCKSLLIGQQPEEFNYCVNLCQTFKDEAQSLSDESVGALGGVTAEELMKQRAAAVDALGKAEASMSSCKQAKESFSKLATQMKGLKDTVNVRFDALRDAEFDLEDARYELEDLEVAIEGEEKAMQEALQVLEQAGADVDAAKKALEAAVQAEGTLKSQVGDTDSALVSVEQKLAAAKNADKVVEELRAAVAHISGEMYLLFSTSVLEPVRDLGIYEELDLSEYFHKDIGALRSAGMMRDTVDALATFCEGEAKESFDAVADQIDLSPLCRIGDASKIKSEITDAVKGRITEVRASIEQVKGWMNPNKSQGSLTTEQIAEFVAGGEPEGLRKVMGVYNDASFFKSYLKHWEFRGAFLDLIARLEQGISQLEAAAADLAKKLASFKDQYTAAIAAREEAEKKLKDAVEAEGLASGVKETLQEKLAELHAQGEELKKSIEELERAMMLAMKKYEEAKQALVEHHQQATSFVETMPEKEPAALLEFQSTEAQQLMGSLRDELEGAKMAQAAIKAKMAALAIA